MTGDRACRGCGRRRSDAALHCAPCCNSRGCVLHLSDTCKWVVDCACRSDRIAGNMHCTHNCKPWRVGAKRVARSRLVLTLSQIPFKRLFADEGTAGNTEERRQLRVALRVFRLGRRNSNSCSSVVAAGILLSRVDIKPKRFQDIWLVRVGRLCGLENSNLKSRAAVLPRLSSQAQFK